MPSIWLYSEAVKILVATVAASLALAGCGSATGDLDAPDSPVARYDWDPSSGGNDALMAGTLELVDGCVVIVGTGDADGLSTVPVFTRQLAAWDADAEVLTYAGVDYPMGTEVAAGGGWGEPTADMVIPEACEPDEWGEVMYVQDTTLATMEQRGY